MFYFAGNAQGRKIPGTKSAFDQMGCVALHPNYV
jgi:hypothetical protein